MKVLISGGTGFIGSALTQSFISQSYTVYILTRKKHLKNNNPLIIYINSINNNMYFDIIINLAGRSINNIWTKKSKNNILSSRLNTTKYLADFIASSKTSPRLFISASAAGIYLNNQQLLETPCKEIINKNFSTFLCSSWEIEASKVLHSNVITQLCIIRLGVVFGKDGFLRPLIILTKYYLGFFIGRGDQHISWIDIEDVCGAVNFIINNNLSGVYNLSAGSVTNKSLMNQIAVLLKRKIFITISSLFVKLFFGQMGKELLLSNISIDSNNLKKSGYIFKFNNILDSLTKYL